MVEFNTDDQDFQRLLKGLGQQEEYDVLQALNAIVNQSLTWQQFIDAHGWAPIELQGELGYPGGDVQHWFSIVTSSGDTYYLAAKSYENVVVVCLIVLSEEDYDSLPSY